MVYGSSLCPVGDKELLYVAGHYGNPHWGVTRNNIGDAIAKMDFRITCIQRMINTGDSEETSIKTRCRKATALTQSPSVKMSGP